MSLYLLISPSLSLCIWLIIPGSMTYVSPLPSGLSPKQTIVCGKVNHAKRESNRLPPREGEMPRGWVQKSRRRSGTVSAEMGSPPPFLQQTRTTTILLFVANYFILAGMYDNIIIFSFFLALWISWNIFIVLLGTQHCRSNFESLNPPVRLLKPHFINLNLG